MQLHNIGLMRRRVNRTYHLYLKSPSRGTIVRRRDLIIKPVLFKIKLLRRKRKKILHSQKNGEIPHRLWSLPRVYHWHREETKEIQITRSKKKMMITVSLSLKERVSQRVRQSLKNENEASLIYIIVISIIIVYILILNYIINIYIFISLNMRNNIILAFILGVILMGVSGVISKGKKSLTLVDVLDGFGLLESDDLGKISCDEAIDNLILALPDLGSLGFVIMNGWYLG